MATDKDFVRMVEDLLRPMDVRTRAMFGEYAFYCDDKVVGFICDNTVLLKPTDVPLGAVEGLEKREAYPGSKLYFVAPAERLDSPWFRDAVQATADALPVPKPKKPAKSRRN